MVEHGGAQAVTGPECGPPGVGVRLEDDQRVEQVAQPSPALDIGQPGVLVGDEPRLLVLEAVEERRQALAVTDADAHRDRVDEQADHRLDTVQLRGAPGDGRAEDHVVAAGEPGKQDAPGALDQGVDRQPARAGEGRQGLGHLPGDVRGVRLRHDRSPVRVGGRQVGGILQTVQRLGPGNGRDTRVLPRQPREVLRVRRRGRRTGARAVRVQITQLAHELRDRPAVQQKVLVGQDQAVAAWPEAHEHQPQERRLGRCEPAPLLSEVAGPPGFPSGLAELREVDLTPGQGDRTRHDGHRTAGGQVPESGAEVVVPVEQCLPGLAQPGGVQRAVDLVRHLDRVDVRPVVPGVERGVEQQARLERRERQDARDTRDRQLGTLALGEGDKRGGRRRAVQGAVDTAVQGAVQGAVRSAVHSAVHSAGHSGDGGQRRDRLVPEDVPGTDHQPGSARPADELHGDDAVAAEGEEVVLGADAFQAEHVGEQPAEQFLARGARKGAGDLGGEVELRQGLAVELAVRGERKGIEHDEGGGNHVLGQHGRDVLPQHRGPGYRGARTGTHVTEPRLAIARSDGAGVD